MYITRITASFLIFSGHICYLIGCLSHTSAKENASKISNEEIDKDDHGTDGESL